MSRHITASWSDPAALAEAGRTMSGIEFLQAIRDGRTAIGSVRTVAIDQKRRTA